MIEKLCIWIASRCRNVMPIVDSCAPEIGPMMIRYRLLRTRFGNLYLHQFLRSDNDRHCHDHPWPFWTLLLTGGYVEHVAGRVMIGEGFKRVMNQRAYYRPRWSFLRRPATWRHWVGIDRPVWTLVFVGPKIREWGFWTADGWVQWQAYNGSKWCNDDAS